MNKKSWAIAGIALLALIAFAFAQTATAPAAAPAADQAKPGWMAARGMGHWGPQLTEAQQAQFKQLMTDLKAKNASKDDVHAAIQKFFADNGIQVPQRPAGKGFGMMGMHRGAFGGEAGEGFKGKMANLTDAQKAALKALREDYQKKVQAIIDGK